MKRALLLLLLLPGCHPAGPAEEEKARAVTCVPLASADAFEERVLRGPIVPPPDRDATLAARVAGTILAIPVREGDHVARGAVLAVIDARTWADDQHKAAAAARASEAVATRKAHLFEHGIVSRAESEAAEAEAAKARAELDIATANLERTRVTSPFDGVVVRISRQVGDSVDGSPSQPIVEVADPRVLELRAEVSVGDLASLRKGQSAQLQVDGYADPIVGMVSAVAPAVSSETGLGVVRISVAQTAGLPVGATATARVRVNQHLNALLVPAGAIRRGKSGSAELVVCKGGSASVSAVRIGIRTSSGMTEILSGASAGDSVVDDGGLGIEDGQKIAPRAVDSDTGDRR